MDAQLDQILSAQLLVAWAGEAGEGLGWWDTDLASQDGGLDLFRQLLPKTWRWAGLRAAREAALRVDAERRARNADGEAVLTLFHFGPELDEALEERLLELQSQEVAPADLLPRLAPTAEAFDREGFVHSLGEAGSTKTTPIGRLIRGAPPAPEACAATLTAALLPLSDAYPLPYYLK